MIRDLIFLAISLFIWGVGESAFFAFQPLYLEQLGADPLRIGAIIGSYGLAATLAHVPAGYLSDRFGRRPLLWAAWIIGLLSTGLMAFAETLPVFVTGMLIYSMTMFVVVPMNSYVAAASGKYSVGRLLTLISASYNAGAILGPLLGGMIGERAGYQMIFKFAAGLFVFSTITILFIRKQPVDATRAEDKHTNLFKNQRYLYFIGVYLISTFAMYLPQPLSPNFLQNQGGLTLTQIGQLYSINSVGIVILNLILGQLDVRLGYLIGQVAVGIFAFLLWRRSNLPWNFIAYFLLGGYRAARSLAVAFIRTTVSGSNMGLAFGLAETMTALALFLSPPLAGYLYDQDPVRVYQVSLILIAVALLANILLFNGYKTAQPIDTPASTEKLA